MFHWGRWLAGPRAGLLAALLAAFSPMLVYYSREAKGYPFVTFFGLLALYLWVRYLDGPRRAHPVLWGAYVLAETLAIGAHYYAFLLVVAQAVWLGLSVLSDPTRRGRSTACPPLVGCSGGRGSTAPALGASHLWRCTERRAERPHEPWGLGSAALSPGHLLQPERRAACS